MSLRRIEIQDEVDEVYAKLRDEELARKRAAMETREPPKERFIRPPAIHSPQQHFMSDKRKKVIGAGILVICIASMVHASDERESPSMGWMLALSATWALIVWMWPTQKKLGWMVDWVILKKAFKVVAALLFVGLSLAAGSQYASNKFYFDAERARLISEHSMAIEGAVAANWYIQPAEKVYREVIALREWKDEFKKTCERAMFGNYSTEANSQWQQWSEKVAELEKKMPEQVDAFLRLPEGSPPPDLFSDVVNRYRIAQQYKRQ